MFEQPENSATDIILDSIADGVFTVDRNWNVTSFNRAAEKIIGISRQDAVGKPCCEVFRSSICESHCALKHTLKTGAPIINRTIYIIDLKGNQIPISISTALLKNSRGAVVGGVETFRDLSQVEELRKKLYEKYSFEDIVGHSAGMKRIFDVLPQVAASDATSVLIGESGTGKELFARAIHHLSSRNNKAFIAINCGALPDTLLESELFGYKAGAFTDAKRDKPGRFALADHGTIFLDEIGDVSPAMQVRLLRFLQEKTFEPLGATKSQTVDVRVIAASNKDLHQLVRRGKFREDLFYRVNVIRIEIPPLRERREDIPLLVQHFISSFNRVHEKAISHVSDRVMAALMTYPFPGNIRELENIIEHAFVLCRGPLIEATHLPPYLTDSNKAYEWNDQKSLSLQKLETIHITNTLNQYHGNRTAAAKALGIHPTTLFRKIKSLGILLPETDGRQHINTSKMQ
ncbi:MAG: sigma 54-interacting transcriptional regulator [Candidatus Hinthialibacter antarcticus]|nr:sigma 54-interacting transcriptional regulator [Candidatus Hinthialibacter antarcticus]